MYYYYPYLRARQYELISLKDLLGNINGNIIPIIEPVNEKTEYLKNTIEKFNEKKYTYSLIINPNVGALKNYNIINENLIEIKNIPIPSFHISSNNYTEVKELIKDNNLNNVMLIIDKTSDINDKYFNELIQLEKVRFILSNHNRSLKRLCDRLKKKFILLSDNFKAQDTNSDYLSIPEEKFTEEHLYFKEDGYHGFSDYTPLSSEFKEGGSLPRAISIHMTYEKEKEIWIRHFTSESNLKGNIQGKFFEACKKAIVFFEEINYTNNTIKELIEYNEKKHYPGLGVIKKISIKSHLELMNQILEKDIDEL